MYTNFAFAAFVNYLAPCRLDNVTGCVSALQAPESGLPAMKQCQGQLDSPEQLQKRLVELGERCMQVVLSMDELHSENDKVCMSVWFSVCLSYRMTL